MKMVLRDNYCGFKDKVWFPGRIERCRGCEFLVVSVVESNPTTMELTFKVLYWWREQTPCNGIPSIKIPDLISIITHFKNLRALRELRAMSLKPAKLYHPEIFQGNLSKKKYFEGWYYKFVSQDQQKAIAIIPGVALYDEKDRHAFIQIIDGVNQHSYYHRFDISEVSFSKKELDFSIGKNRFTSSSATLAVEEINGQINFPNINPLSSSILNPGIMGWYSFTPFMQCYHGIVSLYHKLDGQTQGSFGNINWNKGIGYIEKDWGTSFPKCWIWAHSNNFQSDVPVSIMASVAHIPWMGSYFPGFIVLLWMNGKEYRFATYNQSKMKCTVDDDAVTMSFKRKNLQLDIKAIRGKTAQLRSPILGRMEGKINESLQATLEVSLNDSNGTIWTSVATTAGLEVAGDTTILESETWRK
jgi:tocopherol cyclase